MIYAFTQFWVLRQNYGEKTDQIKMRKLNTKNGIITCPWGGWGNQRKNVIDGVYNEVVPEKPSERSSKGQDRRFVEEMKVGDIVLIPYAKQKTCVIARITSGIDYAVDTGLHWEEREETL
jgi:predicted Mrr-cat superfamily restriction endonuclease